MKGLLLKDLITLKQQSKAYLLTVAIWIAIAIAGKNGAFFSGIICMFTAILPINALSYDERAKWDKYGLTMPVSKKDMVLSKYLLGIITSLVGFVISVIFNIALSGNFIDSLQLSSIVLVLSILALCVVLPLLIKLGVEKARTYMIILFLIPTMLIMLVTKIFDRLPPISDSMVVVGIAAMAIIAATIIIASPFVAIRIFEKKDL